MSALTASRDTLAAALAGAEGSFVIPDAAGQSVTVGVFTEVPEAIEPPAVVIQPADPYLTPSDTFDVLEFDLTLEAVLLVPLRSNEEGADQLDALLIEFLERLPDSHWIESMSAPGPMHTAEWIAHGLPVRLGTRIRL